MYFLPLFEITLSIFRNLTPNVNYRRQNAVIYSLAFEVFFNRGAVWFSASILTHLRILTVGNNELIQQYNEAVEE